MDHVLIEGPERSVRLMSEVWTCAHAAEQPIEIGVNPGDLKDLLLATRNGQPVVFEDIVTGEFSIKGIPLRPDGAIPAGEVRPDHTHRQ